jgi:hypothetical protein
MEDKWFIFFEAPCLYLHRSWTGVCIYVVRCREDGAGAVVEEAWANRDPAEYRRTDDAYDARLLGYLIDRLLLSLPAEFPVSPEADPSKTDLYKHNVVGHARASDEKVR